MRIRAGGARERAGVSKAAGGKALAVQYRCSKVSNVVDEGGCWWSGGARLLVLVVLRLEPLRSKSLFDDSFLNITCTSWTRPGEIYKKGCRCGERLKAKAGGCLVHTSWSGGRGYLRSGK
jgi:hypothetical protein